MFYFQKRRRQHCQRYRSYCSGWSSRLMLCVRCMLLTLSFLTDKFKESIQTFYLNYFSGYRRWKGKEQWFDVENLLYSIGIKTLISFVAKAEKNCFFWEKPINWMEFFYVNKLKFFFPNTISVGEMYSV